MPAFEGLKTVFSKKLWNRKSTADLDLDKADNASSDDPIYNHLIKYEGELWGSEKGKQRTSWFDSPLIHGYINKSISGNPKKGWLDYIKEKYFRKPAKLALNAGCGHGALERLILQYDIAERIEGFDVSAKALEWAKKIAEEEGFGDRVQYIQADANYLEKSDLQEQYDVVFAGMALHHFADLEKFLDQTLSKLKDKGLFITNEFIGPTRFQWTDTQLEATNRFLRRIPKELKKNLLDSQKIKWKVTRPALEYMKEHFAFESICSERIVPAIKERFGVIEQKNYGGTILHLLFEGIMGNFKEETNREHAVIVNMAIEYEKALLDFGVLNHDHSLLICRKR